MNTEFPHPKNYLEKRVALMGYLSDLRNAHIESAVVWVRFVGDCRDRGTMNQLFSVTRGFLSGANAGQFVEQVDECCITAVFERGPGVPPFSLLGNQLAKLLNRGRDDLERPVVKVSVRENVSGLAIEECG